MDGFFHSKWIISFSIRFFILLEKKKPLLHGIEKNICAEGLGLCNRRDSFHRILYKMFYYYKII
jgi:hypothetical protein